MTRADPSGTVNVVCTIDERYTQHCGVMLCSLFQNNPGVAFNVFVLSDGVSRGARLKLDSVAHVWNQRLEWIRIEPRVFSRARTSAHVTLATYFRILIPEVLPGIEKVLFLDADIVVRGPVRELYEESLVGYTHAAIESPLCQREVAHLGLPVGSAYFNAGVLLLNLRRWRDDGISEQVLRYVNSNAERLLWWDQDALNATLCGQWKKCPPTWNAQEIFFGSWSARELGMGEDELIEIRTNPRIVHFTGSSKPWSASNQHPFKGDYYKYLALTPWKDFRPLGTPSARRVVRRAILSITPEFVRQRYRRLAASFRSA